QYSTYSVISPEGCASILWKTAEKAPDAAAALGITADRLHKLNLVDRVIEEPLGGAHRDYAELMKRVKQVLEEQLREARDMPMDRLLTRRFDRIMAYGQFVEK
ncbi:acetyl-CoA carboxylase carboxyl transferase subunit alpha, partial [Kingella kingae]|nr:acetyl-CoA carboxylase carboxyl transferase subunit alpha [Kingella kingae]